jgi:phosphoketolase
MLTANGCSRYDIAIDAISLIMDTNQVVGVSAHSIITDLQHRIREHHKYINANGVDPPHLMDRPTFEDEEGVKGVVEQMKQAVLH